MTNFIPLFPLSIVVFPGEELNLHIFEPRYKQLINDCIENKKPFGIPSVINNEVSEVGTLVQIVEVSKRYDDGNLDIKTKGTEVFRILEKIRELPEKLYHGAIVTYPPVDYLGSASLMKKVLQSIRDLHASLNIEKDFKKPDTELTSFDVAHHAGMPPEEEYELLLLEHELHRQEFLKRHLQKVLKVMSQMTGLKERVSLNGHFKNLEGFKFS